MPRILTLRDVMATTALSRSAVYALMAESRFPKPIRIGSRAVRWVPCGESDLRRPGGRQHEKLERQLDGGLRRRRRPLRLDGRRHVLVGQRLPVRHDVVLRTEHRHHPVTGLSFRQGSAKTKMLLPLLGRSSGVIALQREALPPVPVPATTYWRPSTA